jgi:hypothetical protein
LAATLVVVVGIAASSAGVASAAPAHHHSIRAWLAAHGVDVRRSHAGRHIARTAIVGGSQISIAQAPWQVVVFSFTEIEHEEVVLICGGSILNESSVVTAAHCFFNPETGKRVPPEAVFILAGVSDWRAEHEVNKQVRRAASLRVHPYYNSLTSAGAPDDVAVIALSEGLSLGAAPGSAVSSIGLVGPGTKLAEGAQLNLSGFGQENPGFRSSGELNSIGMTVGYPRKCGGEDDAVFVCASASGGSACFGDSGSGLTTLGASPALVGVMDLVFGTNKEFCRANSTNGFVNLAAPEIRDFIEGNPLPPQAPRGGSSIEVRGVPKAGNTLTCSPGGWSGEPTITYLFIDSASGQVLQSGPSSTYALSASDVGRAILCEVQATNAGGTGVVRTSSLRPIEAAPVESHGPPSETHSSPTGTPPPAVGGTTPVGSGGVEAAKVHNEGVALSGTNLTVQGGAVALAKLDCKEAEGCNGTLTLVAKETSKSKGHRKTTPTRTVKVGTGTFSLEAGETGTAKIHLNAMGRALLSAGHGHLAASLAIEETEVHKWTEGVRLVAQPHKAKGSHKRRG